jgi:hypothetical protein
MEKIYKEFFCVQDSWARLVNKEYNKVCDCEMYDKLKKNQKIFNSILDGRCRLLNIFGRSVVGKF